MAKAVLDPEITPDYRANWPSRRAADSLFESLGINGIEHLKDLLQADAIDSTIAAFQSHGFTIDEVLAVYITVSNIPHDQYSSQPFGGQIYKRSHIERLVALRKELLAEESSRIRGSVPPSSSVKSHPVVAVDIDGQLTSRGPAEHRTPVSLQPLPSIQELGEPTTSLPKNFCAHCNRPGHDESKCWEKYPQNVPFCRHCQLLGHYEFTCRQKDRSSAAGGSVDPWDRRRKRWPKDHEISRLPPRPFGPVLRTISRNQLEDNTVGAEDARITNLEDVSSYNWIKSARPTIMTPGKYTVYQALEHPMDTC